MATDIDYPSMLPMPSQQGYKLQTVSPLLRVDMQSGRARQRRRFTSVPTLASVKFTMDEAQAKIFEGFFRWTISDGAAWFNAPLKTPVGVRHYECRFTDIYKGPTFLTTELWQFSAELEIRERQTVSEALNQFPEFIMHSDIIDLAINREWPEA